MANFQLFDEVKLTENIPLTDGGVAQVGTVGAVVEVLGNGQAYLVELFGNWVKYVVIFRWKNTLPIFASARLFDVLSECVEDLQTGAIVILQDNRYRIRRLPI
jgi:hypothetical protein